MVNCDGTQQSIIDSLSCSVPVSVLRTSPFGYDLGDSVWAKIQASNEKGSSDESSDGNNAILMTVPDAPINLVEDS
jgi:hypothetical protein